MQITIEKTETIKFDCDAERQRILSAFNNDDPRQANLIAIVNEFERGALGACVHLMKGFKNDDWENLHWTITDVISGFLKKEPNIEYRFTICGF